MVAMIAGRAMPFTLVIEGKKQTIQATHPLYGIMRQKAYVSQCFKLRILHQWNNNKGLFAVGICQLRKVMDFQTQDRKHKETLNLEEK